MSLQLLYEGAWPRIRRVQRREFLCVAERRLQVAPGANEGGQGSENLSVCRLERMHALQHGDGLFPRACRVQRDGVDVSIARVVWRQLARLLQL